MDSAKTWKLIVPVFLVALAVNIGMGFKLGMSRPMTSDAEYFLDIAGNVAEGRGYVLDHGYWPGAPTFSRLPGWPAFVAGALKILPRANPNIVMRLLALTVNALAAAALATMAWLLFRRVAAVLVVGTGYVVNPTALYMAYEGMSEPLFVLIVACGTILLLRGSVRAYLAAAVLFGLACLVRTQFLLWVFFAAPIAGAWWWLRYGVAERRLVLVAFAGLCLFLLPSLVWTVRNYRECGRFPVMSTLRGQTFYGGNNVVVADTLDYWGYWVFPDEVPGETPMAALARTMNEVQVDEFYYGRGKTYIRTHMPGMPRLWLGKLVRAYVPVPWKPSLGTWSVSAYRWLLYAAVPIGLFLRGRRLSPVYRLTVAAMVLANVAAVVVFWGCARFAFAMEPFLLPLAALLVMRGEPGRRTEPFRQKTTQGKVTTE